MAYPARDSNSVKIKQYPIATEIQPGYSTEQRSDNVLRKIALTKPLRRVLLGPVTGLSRPDGASFRQPHLLPRRPAHVHWLPQCSRTCGLDVAPGNGFSPEIHLTQKVLSVLQVPERNQADPVFLQQYSNLFTHKPFGLLLSSFHQICLQ